MAAETIRVEGLKQTVKAFRKLDIDIGPAVRAANRTAADAVAATAVERAPRRSGRLARTIRPGATLYSATVRAGGTIPYAGPIIFGWAARNIKPQPFIFEALDARREEVLANYDRQIHTLIEQAFR